MEEVHEFSFMKCGAVNLKSKTHHVDLSHLCDELLHDPLEDLADAVGVRLLPRHHAPVRQLDPVVRQRRRPERERRDQQLVPAELYQGFLQRVQKTRCVVTRYPVLK